MLANNKASQTWSFNHALNKFSIELEERDSLWKLEYKGYLFFLHLCNHL